MDNIEAKLLEQEIGWDKVSHEITVENGAKVKKLELDWLERNGGINYHDHGYAVVLPAYVELSKKLEEVKKYIGRREWAKKQK